MRIGDGDAENKREGRELARLGFPLTMVALLMSMSELSTNVWRESYRLVGMNRNVVDSLFATASGGAGEARGEPCWCYRPRQQYVVATSLRIRRAFLLFHRCRLRVAHSQVISPCRPA